jgi:hypothetical protein
VLDKSKGRRENSATEIAMLNIFLRTGKYLLIVALCISSCVITGCLESSFQLASESRLPKWITLPSGITRKDVSVTLNYYTTIGDDVKVIFKDRTGKTLAEVKGKTKLQTPMSSYPGYVVIVVNSVTEVIEHKKMEPIFYVSDDPTVRKELLGDGPNH